jgi:hypothetical protein
MDLIIYSLETAPLLYEPPVAAEPPVDETEAAETFRRVNKA